MKIGLLAYSTNTGLGYQTLEFYENMNPEKVLIADLSKLNGMPTHHERYYKPRISDGIPSNEDMEWLVDGMDVVFVCETPLNYYLYEYARAKNVKTVQQYNYEFLDYFRKSHLPRPDILAAPSYWGTPIVENLNITKVIYWPVPVDTDKIPYRIIDEVTTFVHIIGRPAAYDRNGTMDFLKAIQTIGKDYKYKIYLQVPTEGKAVEHFAKINKMLDTAKDILGDNMQIITDVDDNSLMYRDGDVLVLPRRYGGLCLPMWEALSAGMPVIMPNISPNNKILPWQWLADATVSGSFQAHTTIPLYECTPQSLVLTMLRCTERIKAYNPLARDIATNMSWEKQKPIYIQRLQRLCK